MVARKIRTATGDTMEFPASNGAIVLQRVRLFGLLAISNTWMDVALIFGLLKSFPYMNRRFGRICLNYLRQA